MTLVRSHYIYLNEYKGGYLYVGSHTWDGPEGELDPNYFGSSNVAKNYGRLPEKVSILEIVSEERRYIAEREWIEKFATLCGIADCALGCADPKNNWVNKYKPHGRLLNLHANNIENALGAITHESYLKAIETKRASEGYEERMKEFTRAGTDASMTRDSIDKRNKARLSTIGEEGLKKFHDAGQTYESLKKGAMKRDYHEVHSKRSVKVTGTKFNRVLVNLVKDNKIIATGSVAYCCRIAGNRNWQVAVSRKLKAGLSSVDCHGFIIQLV